MDKEIMKDLLNKAIPVEASSQGLNQNKPGTPPRNPIIAKKKADEWDETFTRLEHKVDGLIVDGDTNEVLLNEIATSIAATEVKLDGGLATQLLMAAQVRSLTRQLVWRDAFIILLIVIIGLIIGFNTMRLWGWE